MSVSLDIGSDWNFRKIERRLVVVKTKNENNHKVAVLDVPSNLMFTVEVPENTSAPPIQQLSSGQEYLFDIKVLTSKKLEDVKANALSFFEAIDIDQKMEDFIRAYWFYPNKVRFQLIEAENP